MRVYFYTSSLEKLAQARYVFERAGCKLEHFKGKAEPYDEDYSEGTEALLTKAITQIRNEFGVRGVFFVEDTSLRIDALSDEKDFPGVGVKEWFSQVKFEELDAKLKKLDNNRRAVVKSDIALHLPTLDTPIFFHGQTVGRVAETLPSFELNPAYPWLTPHNFSGWLIPDGEDVRLGELEPERSLDIDFRAGSLSLLLDRLYEFNAVAQMDRSAFQVRQSHYPAQGELALGTSRRRIIVVVGHRCAGKTTFGDYLRTEFGATHLEASMLLRQIASRRGEEVNDSAAAKRFLDKYGYGIVADEIGRVLEFQSSDTVVVTGIRTVEEIEKLLLLFPRLEIVNVQADLKTRFFRHIKRARNNDAKNIRDFANLDEEQSSFGLLRVASDVADQIVLNEGHDLNQYLGKIRTTFFQGTIKPFREAGDTEPFSEQSELVRSLAALEKLGKPATCDEIHDASEALGAAVRRYNTNRALKIIPEFAKRIQDKDDLLRYRLTEHGATLLRALSFLGRL